jgi:hypothetical protein
MSHVTAGLGLLGRTFHIEHCYPAQMKNIYVEKSSIAGRGIFAGQDLFEGQFVAPLKGALTRRHYPAAGNYLQDENWVPVAVGFWIDPTFPLKFLNHSCSPNAGFKTPRRLYALRDIKKGEEITADYSTVEYVHFWEMRCSCTSTNCRKTIRSVQFLPGEIYDQYLPYIPRFLRKIHLKHNQR